MRKSTTVLIASSTVWPKPAAVEALKKWDGRSSVREGSGEIYGGSWVSPPEKYRRKYVQCDAFLATTSTENVHLSV